MVARTEVQKSGRLQKQLIGMNWCVRSRRLAPNPFTKIAKTDAESARIVVSRTGTDDLPRAPFAPGFAPATDKTVQTESFPVKTAVDAKADPRRSPVGVKSYRDKRKDSLTSTVNESCMKPAAGVEPATPALRMRCSAN